MLKVVNKIISVSLIVIMVGHLTIIHHIMQDYVLCKGADGHVAIENVNECTACSNVSSFIILSALGVNINDVDNCQDTRLDDNCISDNIFIPKNKIKSNVYIAYTYKTITPAQNEFKIHKFVDRDLIKENHILKDYTTVSLLI